MLKLPDARLMHSSAAHPESKKAEQQISDSEARYRNIFDFARVSMWEQDFSDVAMLLDQIRAEGVTDLRTYFETHPDELAEAIRRVRIKDVNAFTLELFDAEDKHTLLDSLADIFLPETAPVFVDELVALWEGRRRFETEAIVRTLKGRPLDITFTVAFYGERFERTIISILDVSAQKAAERALLKQTHRLETLNGIAKSISSDLNLEHVIKTVTDAATELSGAKFGAFFYNVTDEHGERYTLYTLSGVARSAFEKFQPPRNTALFEPTFRGLGVIRSDDIRADPRYGKSAPHFGMPEGHLPVVSYMAVPVVSRFGEVHGGLFFGHDQPGVFTVESEGLVAAIAAHAAIAIDNAHMLQTSQLELEQRRRAELDTRRLAAIVESSDDAILAKDLEGVITSWNQGAERLFGYTSDEVVGKPVTILIPEDRHDEEPTILARIRRGEHIDHYETIRQRKDGSLVEISLTVSPIKSSDGRIIGASKIARDITERRRAQEQQQLLLREMNHRVKNLFTLAGSLVSLSARSATTPGELASTVGARLAALARAHELTLSKAPGSPEPAAQSTTVHARSYPLMMINRSPEVAAWRSPDQTSR
jgi:PAS domain S-box-containing protein